MRYSEWTVRYEHVMVAGDEHHFFLPSAHLFFCFGGGEPTELGSNVVRGTVHTSSRGDMVTRVH
jgi:hypothetical protein